MDEMISKFKHLLEALKSDTHISKAVRQSADALLKEAEKDDKPKPTPRKRNTPSDQ